MFCSICGKEIANDSNVCGYCGAPVSGNTQNGGNMGNVQGYSNQVNSNQQYYSGQPYNNNQQYNNGNSLKPDNKYNIVAALFTWIWALVKGKRQILRLEF